MREYHKIKTVNLRDNKTHKLTNMFRDEAVEYLKDNEWIFTEKIDGTNIRVYWNGYNVEIAGRTDSAQIPKELMERLSELFLGNENEQMFEQKFNDMEVTLYGEGYGRKIQNGGEYNTHNDKQDFILFDVKVGKTWLDRENVIDIANAFGLKYVPVIHGVKTIQQAIDYIKTNPNSLVGNKKMEGVVGTPKIRLFNHKGERIIVKIKYKDYKEKMK